MNRRTFFAWAARYAALGGLGGERARPDAPATGRPSHHRAGGGFRNPWPSAERSEGSLLRWQWERLTGALPPDPEPHQLPRSRPRIADPYPSRDEIRMTWIGHSTYLIQTPGLNILTDPQFSRRASPVQFMGPPRFLPPALTIDQLPPIDVVLISHDHYDHLDRDSISELADRFGSRIRWVTPLVYRDWMEARGACRIDELDWWETADQPTGSGSARIAAVPAQHWTSRWPLRRNARLWASWAVRLADGRGIFFCGDTGYFPEHPEIRRRIGRFDVVILPIGAYEPRWFMRPAHVNPEEAVRVYRDLGGHGLFCAAHWGTFRLTDEDPLEPPERIRSAWRSAGLPEEDLWVAAIGETRVV